MTDGCVFCDIVAERSPSRRRMNFPEVVAFEPLNPVVAGHMLFVPRMHVTDAVQAPLVTGMVFARVAEYAAEIGSDVNLITSAGPAATQTVFHLHVHVVPRTYGDGLPLPWTPQGGGQKEGGTGRRAPGHAPRVTVSPPVEDSR